MDSGKPQKNFGQDDLSGTSKAVTPRKIKKNFGRGNWYETSNTGPRASNEPHKHCLNVMRAIIDIRIKSLNAELNPICNLLVLLGDLSFMGPCIVSIFQYTSNKMQRYTVYLYPETVLHVSGGNSTHHQERIQLYLHHLVCVTPLLLSAAIVEELEQVWVYSVRPQHTQTSSNSSTINADSSNGVTNTRCCRYSCMRSWWWVELPPETCRAVSRYWINIGIQLGAHYILHISRIRVKMKPSEES
jgi:hypothetical protein